MRILRASVLLLLLIAACSMIAACSRGPRFPETIDFEGDHLSRTTSSQRDRIASIVWTRPGDTLPAAPLQIGAIISDQHQTAKELKRWVDEHATGPGQPYYYSFGFEDNCAIRLASLPDHKWRSSISLVVCQTGVGRAACVEDDETIPQDELNSCIPERSECVRICDQHWAKRREALDILAARMITIR
jgi:hypothetical protein